jgi:Galactose oxidase, central domain/Kelch motif
MISVNALGFRPSRSFVLAGLLTFGLIVNSVAPALAQASGTWTTTGSVNVARAAHTATLLPNGQVLVAGGEDTAGNVLNSAELYNPTTGKWTVTGDMANARRNHTAALLPNGEVLVAGGIGVVNPQAPCTATAELYNPSTGQWLTTSSMTTARFSQGMTLLQNGQVLVAGGDICWGFSGGSSPGASAELYDPSAGTWKATASMNLNHAAQLTLLQSGQALVADETAELYNPSSRQWTRTAAMYYTFGTSRLTTALLTNGDVLVYGNHFACYASEFYNPTANTWSRAMSQCGTGVSYGPLALLGTGKALLAGGFIIYGGKSFPSANSSLYDPSINTWTPTGKLKHAGGHTLTLLLNGQALAVGGTDAELYMP